MIKTDQLHLFNINGITNYLIPLVPFKLSGLYHLMGITPRLLTLPRD